MTKLKALIMSIVFFTLSYSCNLLGQEINPIKKVSRPEKCWAIWHPFKIKKAKEITKKALIITDSIKNTNTLDGDVSGGQLDAFKHAFWMASLTQNMNWRKVWKLGKAHEKGNYLNYKKGKRKGKQKLPDKASSEMDCYNNSKAIEIGRLNPSMGQYKLIQLLIDSIHNGKFVIIKKNKKGQFLDINNRIIQSDSLVGRWETKKTLVPSNFKMEDL